jgi:hypothetical protein
MPVATSMLGVLDGLAATDRFGAEVDDGVVRATQRSIVVIH